MDTPPPVTSAFLEAVRACTWRDSALHRSSVTLHPTVGESGAWSLGLRGLTIAESTYDELVASAANPDGTYTNAAGAVRALFVVAGACEPGTPPPPPPR